MRVKLHSKKRFLLLSVFICLSLSSCSNYSLGPHMELENEEPNTQYSSVLQSINVKRQMIDSDSSFGLGQLYDIDGDGQDELCVLYEYPELHVCFEIWTLKDSIPIQTAAAIDLPNIAGDGFGGVSFAQYENKKYLCFWIGNGEAYPPGAKETFDCSIWQLNGGTFTNAYRCGAEYLVGDTGIEEIFHTYGVLQGADVEQLKIFLKVFHDEPMDNLLQLPHGTSSGIGESLESLE